MCSLCQCLLCHSSTEVKLEAMIVEKDRHIKDLMEEGGDGGDHSLLLFC